MSNLKKTILSIAKDGMRSVWITVKQRDCSLENNLNKRIEDWLEVSKPRKSKCEKREQGDN